MGENVLTLWRKNKSKGETVGENPVSDTKFIVPKPATERNRALVTDDRERFGEIVARIKLQYETGDNGAG